MTVKFIFHPEHITVKKKDKVVELSEISEYDMERGLRIRASRFGEFIWEWKKPMAVPVRETERAD